MVPHTVEEQMNIKTMQKKRNSSSILQACFQGWVGFSRNISLSKYNLMYISLKTKHYNHLHPVQKILEIAHKKGWAGDKQHCISPALIFQKILCEDYQSLASNKRICMCLASVRARVLLYGFRHSLSRWPASLPGVWRAFLSARMKVACPVQHAPHTTAINKKRRKAGQQEKLSNARAEKKYYIKGRQKAS